MIFLAVTKNGQLSESHVIMGDFNTTSQSTHFAKTQEDGVGIRIMREAVSLPGGRERDLIQDLAYMTGCRM